MSIDERILKLPVVWDWAKYKGETVFVGINYEASVKANRAMMDIFYCATDALNYRVIKTVRFDKNKIKKNDTKNESDAISK